MMFILKKNKLILNISMLCLIFVLLGTSGCAFKFGADEQVEVDEQENAISEADLPAMRTGQVSDREYQPKDTLYFYKLLSQELKTVYMQVYEALINFTEDAPVSTLSKDELDMAYRYVMYDHPEIFYSAGYLCSVYKIGDQISRLTFSATYHMTPEEVAQWQQRLEESTERCLQGMASGLSEYEQIKYIYDYIISNTEYDLLAENNQNICSVLVTGRSVCQGYAKTAQYLLEQLGYEVVLVTGNVEGNRSHAWNLVLVDGNYYYMDTTWGDVDYQSARDGDNIPAKEVMPVNYDYFLITTDELNKTHTADESLVLPRCVAMTNNYYVKEGLYFRNFDTNHLERVFSKALAAGAPTVTLKCQNEQLFMEMKSYLVVDQEIFSFIKEEKEITYYDNAEMYTLCFWLE